jgi:hypothetical protein
VRSLADRWQGGDGGEFIGGARWQAGEDAKSDGGPERQARDGSDSYGGARWQTGEGASADSGHHQTDAPDELAAGDSGRSVVGSVPPATDWSWFGPSAMSNPDSRER